MSLTRCALLTGHKALRIGADDVSSAPPCISKRPDWLQLKKPLDEDTQMLYSSIKDLIMTAEWKMIMAKDEAEFEALWTEMKDQAYAMGYETVQEAAEQIIEDAIALDNKFSGK